MARLALPADRPAGALSLPRVAVLMAASLIAPATLVVDSSDGTVEHGPVIAGLSALFFLLVLLRVSGVVARYGRVLDRERTLRSVGADLTAAGDHHEIAVAVRRAVARLFPPGCAQHTELRTGADDVGDPAPAVAFPLLLDGRRLGSLVVDAEENTLRDLSGALEVVASQAALAVARTDLAQEVSRRNNEAYFRTLVHNAHDVILIVDPDGLVRYASPSARTVLGPDSVVGTALLDLIDPDDRDAVTAALAAAEPGTRDYRALRRDGTPIQVEVAHRDLRTDPTVRGVVLTLRDVTEQRRLEAELTHRAFHDPLTGLANRVRFQNCVERALVGLGERAGPVGVLFIDLDDFKLVNDTSGHEAGDQLLIRLADRLTDVVGPDDLAARLGGDEFAVLVTSAATAAEVEQVAARVVTALGAPMDVAGGLQISVSVGVATTTEACGAAEMLRRADLALYAAKGAGKGRWRRYETRLHQAAVDRVGVRTELRHALDTGQLELFYQPIVELTDSRMVGVEALVRWRHPERGIVRPADFIPAAEETGLIVPLGRWALDRALTDLARWNRTAPQQPLSVSVNVSAREVCAPGFARWLLDALAARDLPGDRLVVEITETGLLTEHRKVAADLAVLREHGVRIALDDFGTGYSSLDYVRRHAIDVLKIDRSFTAAVDRSARQAALVGAMIALARALGLAVVAEGIETPAQRDTVHLAGCELGQGYLFATPAQAGQVARWLRHGTFAGLSGSTGARPPGVLAGATPADDS
jgi:diguanylate cyclase (GGDEF)-like protein/PAS domain S-box-containing protein